MGKIAEICEKEKPNTTINVLEKRVCELNNTLLELEKQFIGIRDRVIEDIISNGLEFICPNCTVEFMAFSEAIKSYMKCPRCEYIIVFETL